jgi:NADH-quinone oxidoreductase subunit L
VIGVLLTSLYIFRVVFRVFCGPAITPVHRQAGLPMRLALLVLAALAVGGGYLEIPRTLGDLTLFSDFMRTALPTGDAPHAAGRPELMLQVLVMVASLLGIALAYLLFLRRPGLVAALTTMPLGAAVYRWWLAGWGFDQFYDRFVVEPFVWLAQVNRDDMLDAIARSPVRLSRLAHGRLSQTQSGKARWYAAGIAAGSIVFIAVVVFL